MRHRLITTPSSSVVLQWPHHRLDDSPMSPQTPVRAFIACLHDLTFGLYHVHSSRNLACIHSYIVEHRVRYLNVHIMLYIWYWPVLVQRPKIPSLSTDENKLIFQGNRFSQIRFSQNWNNVAIPWPDFSPYCSRLTVLHCQYKWNKLYTDCAHVSSVNMLKS